MSAGPRLASLRELPGESPPCSPHASRCHAGVVDEQPQITVSRTEWDALLAVATQYVDAFADGEMMTLPERMRLQEVEDILAAHGKRY